MTATGHQHAIRLHPLWSGVRAMRRVVRETREAPGAEAGGLSPSPIWANQKGGVDMASMPVTPHGGPHLQDRTSVYLYYDARGLLIYVGITKRGTARQQEHNEIAEWWPFVARQEIEHYDDRTAAAMRERQLIVERRPPFNRQHNPGHRKLREAYYTLFAPDGMDAPAIDCGHCMNCELKREFPELEDLKCRFNDPEQYGLPTCKICLRDDCLYPDGYESGHIDGWMTGRDEGVDTGRSMIVDRTYDSCLTAISVRWIPDNGWKEDDDFALAGPTDPVANAKALDALIAERGLTAIVDEAKAKAVF